MYFALETIEFGKPLSQEFKYIIRLESHMRIYPKAVTKK